MPQLTIPADTYLKLARRAAAMNVTVEQFVIPALERDRRGGGRKRSSAHSTRRPSLRPVEGPIR